MRKLIALGAVILILVLALTAAATPEGQGDTQDQAFPGERSIGAQGNASTFGGILFHPAYLIRG